MNVKIQQGGILAVLLRSKPEHKFFYSELRMELRQCTAFCSPPVDRLNLKPAR